MLRNIGAGFVGLLVGSLLNMGIIAFNSMVLFPMPEGTDMMDPEQMQAYVATLPAGAFIGVMVAHLSQAFVGGWVAARIGTAPMVLAMTIALLTLLGGVMNFFNLGAPLWTAIEFPLYLVAGWGAGTLAQRSAAR